MKKAGKEILKTLLYLFLTGIFVFLIIHFIGQRAVVNGNSMDPTLADRQSLVVDKISYRIHDPKRFDIIVFPGPQEDGIQPYYIKRIIGLPGETIQIKDQSVFINGKQLKNDFVTEYSGIAEHPLTLKKNEFFCMGDNRPVSFDSRYEEVGIVSRSEILGKVCLRIWPLNKFGRIPPKI